MRSAVGILMAVAGMFVALGAGFLVIGVRTRRSSRSCWRSTSWLLLGSMLGGALFPPAVGVVIARFGATGAPVVLALLAAGSLAAFSAAARRGPVAA